MWLEARCPIIEKRQMPKLWLNVCLKMILVCDWTYTYIYRSSHWRVSHVWWLWPEYGPWPCGWCRITDLTLMPSIFLSICVYNCTINFIKCWTQPNCVLAWMVLNWIQTPKLIWPPINMTPKIWFRLVTEITVVFSCTLFSLLIVNTKLEL